MSNALAVHIAANVDAARRAMQDMAGLIVTTGSAMEKLSGSMRGDQLVRRAHEITAAIQNIGGATKLTAAEAQRYEATLSKAIEKLRVMGGTVPDIMQATQRELAGVINSADRFDNAARKAGTSTTFWSSQMTKLTAAFSAGVLVDRAVMTLTSFGREAMESAGNFLDLSNKLGVSTDAIQRWSFAAKMTGADMETIGRAVVALNDRLGSGEGAVVSAVRALGFELSEIRAMGTEGAFEALGDAVGRIRDPMEQTRVAMDLWGKSGAEILPMLKEGLDKLGDSAPLMSKRTIEAMDKWEERWESLKSRISVGIASVGSWVEAYSEILDEAQRRWVEAGRAIGQVMAFDPFTHTPKVQGQRPDLAPQAAPVTLGTPAAAQTAFEQRFGTIKTQLAKTEESLRAQLAAANRAETLATQMGIKALEQQIADTERMLDLMLKTGDRLKEGQLDSLLGQTDEWIRNGLKLPPMLNAIYEAHRRLEGLRPINLFDPYRSASMTAAAFAGQDVLRRGVLTPEPAASASDLMPVNWTGQLQLLAAGKAGMQALAGSWPSAVATVGPSLREQLRTAAGAFPAMLSTAILQGQSITQALRAQVVTVGADLGKSLGTGLAKEGSQLSKGLGSLFSAGAAIGLDFLAKGIAALVGRFQNATKDIREQFASQAGFDSLGALYDRLRGMGAAGQQLAHTGLNVIGKQDKAANEAWMRQVQSLLDALPNKVDALGQALQVFGGVAPRSVQPLIEQLLTSTNLTDDLRGRLQGMTGAPAWQQAAERAKALGVDAGALGAGFNQSRVAASAFALQHDIELFEQFNANVQDFLPGLSDELSALVLDATRTGAALPKTLEGYIVQLQRMGLLLNENGEAIELGALSFKDITDDALNKVVNVLEDIRNLLAGSLPAAADAAARGINSAFARIQPPNLATGMEYLHSAPMSLVTPLGARGTAAAGTQEIRIEVPLYIDGQKVAEATATPLVRLLPEAVRFYGMS